LISFGCGGSVPEVGPWRKRRDSALMNADSNADFRCSVLAAKISVEISVHQRAIL
jgi:hypothetical protein